MREVKPRLRFKEFKGAFRPALLKDLVEEDRKIRYGIVQPGEYDSNGRFMIRGQDYSSVKGWADKSNFFKVSSVVESKYSKARVKSGDLLITIVGAGTGWVEVVPSFLEGANITQTTGRIAIDHRIASSLYIKNYLLSVYGKKQIYKFIKGQAQPGLNIGDVEIFSLFVPTLPEQQKIASFLSAVDKKIQQLMRKKELLEQYKKGVMQQLFSGKLRFKDGNGKAYPKWEEKRLGDVCEINPSTEELPESFIYIDLESVVKGQLIQENRITKEDAPSRAQRKLQPGDILYQTVRPYQMNNYLFQKDGDYVASTGYAQLRTKEDTKYIYQLLHSENFVNEVIERCTGTSFPAINSKDLGKIKVLIPHKEEQQKIASYLSSLDAKIEIVGNQIMQSQTFKKGLLQQMFV